MRKQPKRPSQGQKEQRSAARRAKPKSPAKKGGQQQQKKGGQQQQKPGQQQQKPGQQQQKPAQQQQQQQQQKPAQQQQQQKQKKTVNASAPVGKNQNTNSAKSSCPLVVRHPCDVTSFKLTVLPRKRGDSTDDPASSKIELETKKPKRSPEAAETQRLRKIVGHPMSLLLQRYDFVIETLASFHFQSPTAGSSTGPETTIDIEAEATWEGKCSKQIHPRLYMRPITSPGAQLVKLVPTAPPLPEKLIPTMTRWPVGKTKAKVEGIQALTTTADLFMGQDALTTFFRVIFFAMTVNSSVDLEFWADSEGVPVDPARKPNRLLNGLVRIFRDVQVGIAITIPRGKKVTEELKNGKRLDHTKSGLPVEGTYTSKDYRSGSKMEMARNDHGWSFSGLETMPKGQYSLAFKLNDFEIVLKEEDKSWADVKKGLYTDNKARMQSALSRAKTGAQRAKLEAKLAWELRQFLSLSDYLHVAWQHLVNGIKGIRAAMGALVEVFKKAPQLGWKFEYEFTFWSVGASVTFSRKSSSQVVEGRVVPLQWNGKFELSLTVIDVKWTLSFGLLVDLVALRLEARVYGTVGGAVTAKFECSLLDDAKTGFEGKATGKLGAVFEARALWKVIRREIAIEAGFVTEGGLTWKGADKKLQWEFKMRTLPVQWYIVATNERTGQSQPKYYTLCEPRTVYQGQKLWDIK